MITLRQAAGMAPPQRAKLLEQVAVALQRNRRNVDALLSGAALHHVENRTAQTVEHLKKAFALQPENLMIAQWLAVASAEIRDFKEAKAVSARLVRLDAKNPENWQIRGRILDGSGDPAGALEAFEKQLAITGEQAELVFQIANCHFYLGDVEKALEGYRRTSELDPSHALALYAISTIHKFAPDEVGEYLDKVEKAVPANADQPLYNTSALYYGAGKALDDAKRHDEAFSYYRKANDVRREPNSFELTRPFENAKAIFTPQYLEERSSLGDQSRRPIFVLGMPRSGTTLVESILAAHPKIRAAGEVSAMTDIAVRIGLIQAPLDEVSEILQHLGRKEISAMCRDYLDDVRRIAGADNLVTDKMPHNFLLVGLIQLMFPKAKIIHCRRDPVDTCVSIYTNGMTPVHNYYKSDLSTLGAYYNRYLDLMAYWHELLPGKILDVYYEDLVINQELNSRRLIDHVGVNWDDSVLARSGGQDAVKTLSAWQVRQPVYTSATGKWKRYEKHLGPLLEALGGTIGGYEQDLKNLGGSAT